MNTLLNPPKLKMLPSREYVAVKSEDPIRFYHWPIIGALYRRRVERCLVECLGGKRVLEVGFGSGVSFLNLHDRYEEIYGIDLTAQADEVCEVFSKRGIETFLRNGTVLDMPYSDNYFDTVLLISILEHLKVEEQATAFKEIFRVLKPGGQVVYGVPVERPAMHFFFLLLGYNIRRYHFSTEKDVRTAAERLFRKVNISEIKSLFGPVYQVGSFKKPHLPVSKPSPLATVA
jgi:ubiquinone/menaquinone biosynthesis C-methylase UbiE